jgi:hypothetical protein
VATDETRAAAPWDGRWQQNTCPICERTFTVTPSDDYFIPACGCYDDAEPGHYPCESCGIPHVYACMDKGSMPERRFTAIVGSDEKIIASIEGEREGAALADEFIVRPS